MKRHTKRVEEDFEEFAHDRGVVESFDAGSCRLGVLKDNASESQMLASHRVVVDIKIFHCPGLLDLNTTTLQPHMFHMFHHNKTFEYLLKRTTVSLAG